jgi:hypothetical protein
LGVRGCWKVIGKAPTGVTAGKIKIAQLTVYAIT